MQEAFKRAKDAIGEKTFVKLATEAMLVVKVSWQEMATSSVMSADRESIHMAMPSWGGVRVAPCV